MPAVVVDSTLCKKDGLCVSVCPLGILEQRSDSLPATRKEYETSCVRCGHCVAVCPRGALLLEGMQATELEPLDPTQYPDPAALSLLMRGRRSIRLYKDELVEREAIEHLLNVARWAPSGKNVQPLSYTVSSGRERMREIAERAIEFYRLLLSTETEKALALGAGGLVKAWSAGKDLILRDAPQLIAAHGPKHNPTLMGSGMIALTQVELLATAHGLGACWAGFIQIASVHAPLRAALGLPEQDALAGALMLGKPRVTYRAVPPRKPLDLNWR